MTDDSLIQALPELIAFVGRDGTVLRHLGGRALGFGIDGHLAGSRLTDIWPEEVAAVIHQMIRRSLRDRGTSDAEFRIGERGFEVRIAAHGRDRVLCIVREARKTNPNDQDFVRENNPVAIERRALFTRLNQSIAETQLREQPLAILLIHMQGILELGRILDFGIVDQVAATQLDRIVNALTKASAGYAGKLTENSFIVVAERFEGRESVRDLANYLIKLIGEPVAVGDAKFTSVASVGIAVMGEDGQTARLLIESARSAMLEARRNGTTGAQFYSDTLKFRSLARLDMENELRQAIDQHQLALRYCARHDLYSGERIAIHAYLHWPNAVRGEVAAAEFLPIAESTGLAPLLSKWALGQLQRDIPLWRARGGPPARFSFGALKSHLVSGCLVPDLSALFATGTVLPADFELRISERALASLSDPSASLQPLVKLGIAIVIDEFGRGFTSLPRLARLPIHALQLDRRLALASATDPIARRAAAAAMAVAKALEFKAVAAGVDNEAQRQLMRSLGCLEGLGDAFGGLSRLTPENTAQPRRRAQGE